jgi:hypothetical protein
LASSPQIARADLGSQVDGPHPEVGLVTIDDVGGNDVLFSHIVIHGLNHDHCMDADFTTPGLSHRTIDHPTPGSWRSGTPTSSLRAGGSRLTDCDSVQRRFSGCERDQRRSLPDQFNDLHYERAVSAGIEFVSPDAPWDDHEPCGPEAQVEHRPLPLTITGLVTLAELGLVDAPGILGHPIPC